MRQTPKNLSRVIRPVRSRQENLGGIGGPKKGVPSPLSLIVFFEHVYHGGCGGFSQDAVAVCTEPW